MTTTSVEFENRFYESFLAFFHRAEAHRRWNLQKDIPWKDANPNVSDRLALVAESFMAVELYLPDYTRRIMELVRQSRGRAWFQANWGYEECKHSLGLEMWLVASGKRTDKEIREFTSTVLERTWDLPFQTPRQMMIYTTFQELATGLNYRRLREKVMEQNDPALVRLLSHIAGDESAHYQFFMEGVKLFLETDRDKTLEDIRHVLGLFRMPAQDLIPNWEHRGEVIVGEKIFSDRIFFKDIVKPVLQVLGTSRDELKALQD